MEELCEMNGRARSGSAAISCFGLWHFYTNNLAGTNVT